MEKYMAVYDVLIQPYEDAPERESRNHEIVAENEADAKKQAEVQRTNWLRNELLSGSTVTLTRLFTIEDIL